MKRCIHFAFLRVLESLNMTHISQDRDLRRCNGNIGVNILSDRGSLAFSQTDLAICACMYIIHRFQ